jgi:thiol peroxidase
MSIIKCRNTPIETIGDAPSVGTYSPNFSVCNGDFRLFNLNKDFKDKPLVIFVLPSVDTSTCMLCLHHFSELAIQKKINYLIITSDTPFALKRITTNLPFNTKYVCTDMVLREFGTRYGVLVKSGPLESFVARSVFVLDKNHQIKYVELAADISEPINYEVLENEIDRYFPSKE